MEKRSEEEKILKYVLKTQCWHNLNQLVDILNLAMLRYGCPKKMAEEKFYETIAAIKKEREAKAAEEKEIEEKFDPK